MEVENGKSLRFDKLSSLTYQASMIRQTSFFSLYKWDRRLIIRNFILFKIIILSIGYYSLCIDNKPSSFQSKLVSLYLASLKRDEWEKYVQELSEADVTSNNATALLRNVQWNINEMMKYLEHSKQQHSYDGYLAESNNRYVQNWSLLQCIIIIACSIVQVIFVRKLFESNEFGAKGKVRA